MIALPGKLENVTDRISILGNGEAGCEQGISEYNRAKNKFSSVMNIDIIEARMRISLNGPPIHIFDSDAIVKYWTSNGHRYAEKAKKKANQESKVIVRIRREETTKYTSRIFTKKYQPY